MDARAGKPPRWEWVPVDVTIALREADIVHSAEAMRTFDLTNDAGEQIGQAIASVDTRQRRVVIRELRYDASRATEAEARRALERFLSPAADEAAGEVVDA